MGRKGLWKRERGGAVTYPANTYMFAGPAGCFAVECGKALRQGNTMSASSSAGQTGVDAHDSAGIADNAAALAEAGDSFVAQYIGTDPATEDGGGAVTHAQAQADLNAGLQIVSIFETNGMSSTVFGSGEPTLGWETYLTEAQGEADAASARAAAEALGQPAGSAIYFAMDFDPANTGGTITEATALAEVNAYFTGIDDYFAAVTSGPAYSVGAYGAGATLQSISEAGLAQDTWLARSTGWAGYTINEADGTTHGWNMIQSAESPFDSVPVNQDQTDSASFGAWGATLPCYVMGTRLLTESGEVAVERLRPGTRMELAGGGMAPVAWIGHRRVDCRRHPRPRDVWPVRVRAGAFGPGLPARDLWLSPDHAVFAENVLIPVRHLVNSQSIAQARVTEITYFHVELPAHGLLLAEGLPCESFLDTGNRAAFANGGAATHLHPEFAQRRWDAESCAPLVVAGRVLARVRRKLRLVSVARAQGGERVLHPVPRRLPRRETLAGVAGEIGDLPVIQHAPKPRHRAGCSRAEAVEQGADEIVRPHRRQAGAEAERQRASDGAAGGVVAGRAGALV
jgi:collagen type I/II/III/V/XI/XXIV/XXVII alpha